MKKLATENGLLNMHKRVGEMKQLATENGSILHKRFEPQSRHGFERFLALTLALMLTLWKGHKPPYCENFNKALVEKKTLFKRAAGKYALISAEIVAKLQCNGQKANLAPVKCALI